MDERAQDNLEGQGVTGADPDLAAVLSGELPCWSCKYDLTGLSVTSQCPECGTPVRATLLAIVDPEATSFIPLQSPALSAIGLVTWSGAALAAIFCVLLLRVSDLSFELLSMNESMRHFGVLVPVLTGLSGLGALAFIRPHNAVRALVSIRSIAAVVLYAPLVWLLWNLHVRFDVMYGAPYFGDPLNVRERVIRRIGIGLLVLVIALLLRPGVREFAKRSVLLRTGQLSRQTVLALASAVLITLGGDLVHFSSLRWPVMQSVIVDTVWMAFVVIGSAMILIGFIGMFIDSLRLFPVLRKGPKSLRDVIRKEAVDGPE
ncbi:MAG: hypothetical protein ED559_07100 [Phycisphaera sp.]|nr:MAG: hypothetical protein ED559_07100 [Phycisphaera sp.]